MKSTEDHSLVDALVQVSFAVTATLTRVASAEGLSLTQLRLLGILRGRTPTLSALADRVGLDRSSVSGLVDRAVSRDLVRRVPSEVDRRSHGVELTAHGRQVAARLTRQVEEHLDLLTADLSPDDQAALDTLLRSASFEIG